MQPVRISFGNGTEFLAGVMDSCLAVVTDHCYPRIPATNAGALSVLFVSGTLSSDNICRQFRWMCPGCWYPKHRFASCNWVRQFFSTCPAIPQWWQLLLLLPWPWLALLTGAHVIWACSSMSNVPPFISFCRSKLLRRILPLYYQLMVVVGTGSTTTVSAIICCFHSHICVSIIIFIYLFDSLPGAQLLFNWHPSSTINC